MSDKKNSSFWNEKWVVIPFPETEVQHDVLATLWARTRIDDLMNQDLNGLQRDTVKDDVKEAISQLGLEYRLMTQFTSFVAVEETIVTEGGQPRRVDVPVELPEGMNRRGLSGDKEEAQVERLGLVGKFQKSQGIVVSGQRGGRAPAGVASMAPPLKSTPSETVNIADAAPVSEPKLSAEDQKRRQLQSKLHPSVAWIVERLKNNTAKPAVGETKFVNNGKAEVQIWLTDKSDTTIESLKKLGVEVIRNPKSSKFVIGRLPIEKLEALAGLAVVTYISPQTR